MNASIRRLTTWPHLKASIFFILLSLVMLYPASLRLSDSATDIADPPLNSWILAWTARALPSQPLDLYQANIFYPYSNTLAYTETLLGLAPFSAPIIWLTGNPLLAHNLLTLLGFALSGLGMYALVYRFTRNVWAGLIAGVIFAFNPFRMAHVSRIQLATAQWIPLALLFLDRLVEKRAWRDWGLFALFFNLQVLSCYYYAAFISIGVAVLLATYWLTRRAAFGVKLCLQLIVFGLLTAAINIPLILPFLSVARSMNFERSLSDAIHGAADLKDFVTVGPGNWLYGNLTAALREDWWYEHVLFPGAAPVVLALSGMVAYLRHRTAHAGTVLRYTLLLITSLILSLGPELRWNGQTLLAPLPYQWLYEHIPVFSAIRQPARIHIITMVCLSVLAGYGFIWLIQKTGGRWRVWAGSLVIGVIAAEYISIPLPLLTMPIGDQIPAVYRWLNQQPGNGPILELPMRTNLRDIEGPRVYYSAFHWKPMVNGYSGWHTPVYTKLLGFTPTFPDEPSLRWIVGVGVQYVIVHRGQLTPDELARLDAQIGEYAHALALVQSFGDDQVYQVLQPLTGQPTSRGGRDVQLNALTWLGYWLVPAPAHPGDQLTLRLFWQRRGDLDQDYIVSTTLLDTSGVVVAQHTGVPVESTRPTSSWRLDEVIMDKHLLQLPPNLPPGRYEVRGEMYLPATGARLPFSTWQNTLVGDSLSLGWLTVNGQEPKP